MANIFAILTAVILAIAGFLAFQNMGNSDRPGRGYKGWIKKRENEQAALDRKERELKNTRETLATTESNLEQVEGENAELDAAVRKQLEKNEEITARKDQKKAESQAKAAEVRSKEEDLAPFGNVEQVVAEIEQMRTELAELETEVDEKEAKQAELQSRIAATTRSADAVRGQIDLRVNNRSNPDLSTTVRNVYPSLGFVTLAAGDNEGVVKGSPLEVVRDGEVMAKLIVTTVEATTAAADVVPGSVAEGRRVIAGDRVRAPKQEETEEPAGGATAAAD